MANQGKNSLLIRDYKTSATYLTPSQIIGMDIKTAIFNNTGTVAFVPMNNDRVNIIDLTNPASASIIGTINFSYYWVNALEFRGSGGQDTLFLAGTGFKGLRTYNVTTPSSPTLIATSNSGDSLMNINKSLNDIVVIKDSIYIADRDSGFRSFPRSNINFEGKLTPIVNTNTNNLSSAKGDSFLVISCPNGLRIRDIKSGAISTFFNNEGWGALPVETVMGWGNLIYCAFFAKGFRIYDISNPMSPVQQGSGILTGDYVWDVVADDRNYAYIANGTIGVRIIDLSSHNQVGSPLYFQSGESYQKVLIKDNILIMLGWNSFSIVDVSVPSSPVLRGTQSTGNGCRDADYLIKSGLSDSLFLVIGDNDGIKVFNIQNPQNITQIGTTVFLPGGCDDVQFVEIQNQPYIIGAHADSYFKIWRFNLDATPIPMDSLNGGKFAISGNYAYSIRGDSVQKINIFDPYNILDSQKFNVSNYSLKCISN